MTAAGVYASRFGRVLLADPTRGREVFTAARARGEVPRPPLSLGAALAGVCVLPLQFALSGLTRAA